MKTFYLLLLTLNFCAIASIMLGAATLVWQCGLIFLVISLSWREMQAFSVQSIALHGDKISITDGGITCIAQYQATSVVTRYLCFLHLYAPDIDKRWWVVVSGLEFRGDSFRYLKSKLRRF